ncbi:beta-xylosidase/alpha-l-arabinosidase [Curtobacterium ammoniigenes]|uniref:beta-xylosidase/alpha-l-arabinosidase n=1 Tax=Curtobacterium ammoniigenes TaxID=395387 RepID=UPI00082A1233|nr:glycoside hydrolase family 3 N-terminal domain-containing protein [Curtobacterium ammoniigenes]
MTITRTDRPWTDPSRPVADRVDDLIAAMTLEEKLGQLVGVWVGISPVDGDVAPFQHEMSDGVELDAILPNGLGQLTRPFGSAPVDPAVGAVSLARTQRRVAAANRFGIPAIAHEECLAGFTAWGATAYPVPLSWGATFDPDLVRAMAERIGRSMRSVGVHQGLAPVLDVVRDPRWGRVEETIGEDPYLVGTIATSYIRGLESTGIVATLKHFIGYSASTAGRNLAPVSMGSREFADVMTPPFEMAVRDSGVRSVMHAYTAIDGVPSAADPTLLTGLLRDEWGFTGTVVADYFGVAFLKQLHGVAESWGDAAAQALRAGVDVELPTVKTFSEPLVEEIRAGRLDEAFVDRALRRVLTQKAELGLLDADWNPIPDGFDEADLAEHEAVEGRISLDTPEDRALARRIAEEAVVLVANDGSVPLGAQRDRRILVTGPTAADPMTLLGCYSFPGHVGALHPDVPLGIEIPSLADALRAEFPAAAVNLVESVPVTGGSDDAIASAVQEAREADLVVVALGDRAGLFGRGTSGEGCDAPSMQLPGRQLELLEALLDTGTPVIVVLIEGRPYALGTAPERAAAIVAGFFPGEEGAGAIAGVLSGRVAPSGRLPVSIPKGPDSQPTTYLTSTLGRDRGTSNIDQHPAFAFGHGLSTTAMEWSDLAVDGSTVADAPDEHVVTVATDGTLEVSVTVRNAGERAGVEVVQLYVHDPVASVVQPTQRLVGYARVALEPSASATCVFRVAADVAGFTGRDRTRIVEPGRIELRVAASSDDIRFVVPVDLVGEQRTLGRDRAFGAEVRVH